TYDVYGNRISLKDATTPAGGPITTGNFLYGYNTHGDVSLLTDQSNGTVRASYGYTPYGTSDAALSKGDTAVNTPFNPYRYSANPLDSGSQTYAMGARRYDPGAQRFLQLDQFQGALADLALATDPLTQNRYDLAASNPLSAIEWDGHVPTASGSGGAPCVSGDGACGNPVTSYDMALHAYFGSGPPGGARGCGAGLVRFLAGS